MMNPEMARKLAIDLKDSYFLGQDGKNQFARVYSQKPVALYFDGIGKVYSNDPRHLDLARRLSTQLREAFPKDVRSDGLFGPTAIGGNFTELLTVAGCPMNPMTYNPVDNSKLREELNLNVNFNSTRHLRIYEEFLKIRYANHDDSRGKISKISGSGFPIFTHDISVKIAHLNHIATNVNQILDGIAQGNLSNVREQHAVILASSVVLRTQAEGGKVSEDGHVIPKERLVNDLEYALTSGERGKRFPASKQVTLDGIDLRGHFAGRARSAYSIPNPINSTFTAAIEGLRHYGDNLYEFTYKHRTREGQKKKVEKFKFFLPLDVGQYDQSMPWYMVEKWLEFLPFNDRARKVISMILKAPKFYSAVSSTHDPIWTGNPEDSNDYQSWGGLPSGAFLTSMMGKDLFTFTALTMFDDYFHDVVGNVDKILKGEHKYGLLNASDDTILMSNDQDFFTHLRSLQEVKGSMTNYFKVEIEDGFKFLGECGYVNEDNKFDICADIGSYFKNMLCPERGIDSRLRQYALYGMEIRRQIFQTHPKFFEAEELFLKLYRDIYKLDWNLMLEKNMVRPSVVDFGQVMSQADIEVRLDPKKLYYKYDHNDVSPDLIDQIEEKISEKNTAIMRAAILTI